MGFLGHIEGQVKKHLRPDSNSSDAIEKRIKEMKDNGTGPVHSVTPDNFLNASRPLMQVIYDIHNESGDLYKDKPVELFKDGLHARVIEMLKCVQALEFETKSQEIAENLSKMRNDPIRAEHDAMYEVLAWAKDELYRCARHANAYMKDVYSITETTPLDIEKEWEKKIIPAMLISQTRDMQQKHESAYHRLTQLFDPLIKHGLPAETKIRQWYDRNHSDDFREKPHHEPIKKTLAEIKQFTELAVKDVIRAQLMLDKIEHIDIPKIKLYMVELQAKAAYEDVAIEKAGLRGRSSYWEEYRECEKALKQAEKIIRNMRDREKARLKDATLSITCDKNGAYTITAERTKGKKKSITMQDGEITIKKNRNAFGTRLKRVMELGQLTTMLRKEQEERQAMIYEFKKEKTQPTHNPDRKNEERKSVTERVFGKVGILRTRQTQYSGEKAARLQLTGLLARLSKNVTKSYEDGIEKKEEKVWSAAAEIGGTVKAELPRDKFGTPTLSAEAHISGEAKVKIFGFSAKAGPSAAIGKMMSYEDFRNSIRDMFEKEVLKGGHLNAQAIVDHAVGLLRDVGLEKAMDWGTFKIEVSDFTLGKATHSIERDDQTQEHSHKITATSPLFNDSKQIITTAAQKIAEAQKHMPPELGFFYGDDAKTSPAQQNGGGRGGQQQEQTTDEFSYSFSH